jgi:starch synthase
MTPDQPLTILFVASEASPFAKTGGLGDVVGSLPPALQAMGHDVHLILPWYRSIRDVTGNLRRSRTAVPVQIGDQVYPIHYRRTKLGQVNVYFIDAAEFYDRPGLYGEQGVDYSDNAIRFALLSRGALELARRLKVKPDIVHAHDWQAALAPIYLRESLNKAPFFAATGSLLTIHNLGYQGLFPPEVLPELGLDTRLLNIDELEYFGQVNLLKGGIVAAQRVSTVSPTYTTEIQTPSFGMGLDGLLRFYRQKLHGILNGLDETAWNPATDRALSHPFSTTRLKGKTLCKRALQEELGLQPQPGTPLAAMVTRLDPQKGIELLLEQWDIILQRDLQLVVLGSGRPEYEQQLTIAAERYPGRVVFICGFDDALARRIYAGSDLFLMPSLYEPCGLGQLIALRYGCLPVVHATGGLADTIIDPRDRPDRANGFLFREFTPTGLLEGLDRSLASYSLDNGWQTMVRRGMKQDLSWQQAAGEYEKLYRIIKEELE